MLTSVLIRYKKKGKYDPPLSTIFFMAEYCLLLNPSVYHDLKDCE